MERRYIDALRDVVILVTPLNNSITIILILITRWPVSFRIMTNIT